jgi:Tripartite tricarboxylate transporter family receptor
VPFPAGGPTDALARILADRMKGTLGQSVVVENPTGAAGTIGTGRVARATPDGYTVILGHWQTHVVNGATYTLPFDVVKDFEPISLVADCPVWFVARASLPQKDLRELIAWMKENPGKATVGIGGVGGGADVVGTYFNAGRLMHQSADVPGDETRNAPTWRRGTSLVRPFASHISPLAMGMSMGKRMSALDCPMISMLGGGGVAPLWVVGAFRLSARYHVGGRSEKTGVPFHRGAGATLVDCKTASRRAWDRPRHRTIPAQISRS